MNYYISKIKNELNEFLWTLKRLFIRIGKEKVESKDISIIVVGRNDNYGGDFSLCLKTTLDWNIKQLPDAEVIYIEWNKIEEKESDCNWIEQRYKNAKCYIVPNQIHTTVNSNPKMPVMEYFAKNIGTRKATRDWIIMINADCLIGNEMMKNITRLNKKYVYGTHYISFKWDGNPIEQYHFRDKKNIVIRFPAQKNLSAVVGNFIMTYKSNWVNATGYDERLTNVRAGVDDNGLEQLRFMGLKTAVLGHHYHLDHPESIIHGANTSHGENEFKNIPYKNNEQWGFINYPLKQISERIWQLEKI